MHYVNEQNREADTTRFLTVSWLSAAHAVMTSKHSRKGGIYNSATAKSCRAAKVQRAGEELYFKNRSRV